MTAPTNGPAWIARVVKSFYSRRESGADDDGMIRFLLAAAAMGML